MYQFVLEKRLAAGRRELESTTLQEGDDILWRDEKILFQRRMSLDKIGGYVRLRATSVVELKMYYGEVGSLYESLPLVLENRRAGAWPVILTQYGEMIPGLHDFNWTPLSIAHRLPGRQRFRALAWSS